MFFPKFQKITGMLICSQSSTHPAEAENKFHTAVLTISQFYFLRDHSGSRGILKKAVAYLCLRGFPSLRRSVFRLQKLLLRTLLIQTSRPVPHPVICLATFRAPQPCRACSCTEHTSNAEAARRISVTGICVPEKQSACTQIATASSTKCHWK